MSRNSVAAAACVLAGLVSSAARAQTADVIHWWTSGSESKALAVFADEYKKRGGTWVDNAVVGGPAARTTAVNRIAGGNPPTAMQWNVGVAVRNLAVQGVLENLDDVAGPGGWTGKLPKLIADKISVDGHVYAVPVDVAGVNMVFYNKKIFDDLHLTPATTWDEFFVQADKIKAAGFIPLAVGGQPWQEELLWQTVVLGTVGPETYKKIFIDHDAKIGSGPEMVKAFDTLRKITTYVDQGSANRKWNDTALLVENGKAAMQIMGDWEKGEMIAAGKKLDADFGCAVTPGSRGGFIITVDVFAFPKSDKPDAAAARKKLAAMMIDPDVQVAFNRVKGAVPPRRDAVMTPLDSCSKIGEDVIQNHPDMLLPNIQLSFSADTDGQVADLMTQFWNTPSMTSAQAAAKLGAILADADTN